MSLSLDSCVALAWSHEGEQTDEHAWSAMVQLADRFRLTVYDAAYFEGAQYLMQPLSTLDEHIRMVAKAAGVEVLPRKIVEIEGTRSELAQFSLDAQAPPCALATALQTARRSPRA